jgi:hypothetical protein
LATKESRSAEIKKIKGYLTHLDPNDPMAMHYKMQLRSLGVEVEL